MLDNWCFHSFLHLQLVETEGVRGVVTMNELYETKYFCNSAEVSLLSSAEMTGFDRYRHTDLKCCNFDVLWQEWHAAGVEQLRLSTVDLTGVPSLENLHRGVEFALKYREQGSSVYVHCKAGRSRSATLVAAYLIRVSRSLFISVLHSGCNIC